VLNKKYLKMPTIAIVCGNMLEPLLNRSKAVCLSQEIGLAISKISPSSS
jgi:hypothetical protein